MSIKLYADGANLSAMATLARSPQIAGFTTNPTLARAAGVGNYRTFCAAALEAAAGKPTSLEVLADDFEGMVRQAELLAGLGPAAIVKIPVTTTDGTSTVPVIAHLAECGIPLNITAVFTTEQIDAVGPALGAAGGIVSIFAGRIADAGVNPRAHVAACGQRLWRAAPQAKLLWASSRQAYDFTLAEEAGCDIITMTPDLIIKLALRGKPLAEYSRETVEMFARDARAAGFEL